MYYAYLEKVKRKETINVIKDNQLLRLISFDVDKEILKKYR